VCVLVFVFVETERGEGGGLHHSSACAGGGGVCARVCVEEGRGGRAASFVVCLCWREVARVFVFVWREGRTRGCCSRVRGESGVFMFCECVYVCGACDV